MRPPDPVTKTFSGRSVASSRSHCGVKVALHHSVAVREESAQLRFDATHPSAEMAEGRLVLDAVNQDAASLGGLKDVLMPPRTKRPPNLRIDKATPGLHV